VLLGKNTYQAFENESLERIFRLKKDKQQLDEENYIVRSLLICTLYGGIVKVKKKSRRMRWVGHVESVGEIRDPERNVCFGGRNVGCRVMLKRILDEQGAAWMGFSWPTIGSDENKD
jgi:hypothetical protein